MAPRFLAAFVVLVAVVFPVRAVAQDPPPASVSVTLQPVGESTLSGLALLSAAGDATTVQLLVLGVPTGTAAIIHHGTCAAIDPSPIALLGDVGAAGQIQTTVPVPFVTLTAGGYLIALHAGLTDLATAIACGEIPDLSDDAYETPTPASSGPPVVQPTFGPPATSTPDEPDSSKEQTYTSETYGYSFSWDDRWSVRLAGDDAMMLSGDHGNLWIQVLVDFGGDPVACLDAIYANMVDRTDIEDIQTFADETGRLIGGSDAYAIWEALSYLNPGDNAATGRRVQFNLCRRLTRDAVLSISHTTFANSYAEDAAARDAVLATLVVPGQRTAPTAVPSAVPTTPPVPATSTPESPNSTPAATLPPKVSPDCAGVAEWVTTVRARLNRLIAITEELNAELLKITQTLDLTSYKTALAAAAAEVQGWIAAMESGAVPSAAADINADLVEALKILVEAAYMEIDNLNSPSIAKTNAMSEKRAQGNALLIDGRRQLDELAGRCGVG